MRTSVKHGGPRRFPPKALGFSTVVAVRFCRAVRRRGRGLPSPKPPVPDAGAFAPHSE